MKHWEKFLNPLTLRKNLIEASVFISAYEICKRDIIDKPKSFFEVSWSLEQVEISKDYDKKVLALAKSPLEASLLWFKEIGAVDDSDINSFSNARELRNKIAHNLPDFVTNANYEIDYKTFDELLYVTHKIGVWWVINMELAIDPFWEDKEVDENEIQTGTIMMIQMMRDIAYGNEPKEGYYYENIINRKTQ